MVPLTVLLVVATASVTAAVRLHAAVLHGGPWTWLGDAAVIAGVIGGLAVLGVPSAIRTERVRRSGITDVDVMSGDEFEGRLAALFCDLGYAVTHTGARGDFGADLLCERDGERVVVQAKRYDGSVGIEAVQQVIGATRYYGAGQALVVTNSACTPAAEALAAAHGVELVERDVLTGLLAAHPLASAPSTPVGMLVREVVGGSGLVLFAVGALLRMVWWTGRTALRLTAAFWRAGR
jgi:restriction system protein